MYFLLVFLSVNRALSGMRKIWNCLMMSLRGSTQKDSETSSQMKDGNKITIIQMVIKLVSVIDESCNVLAYSVHV